MFSGFMWRARRGEPIWFMALMRVQQLEAFHEPPLRPPPRSRPRFLLLVSRTRTSTRTIGFMAPIRVQILEVLPLHEPAPSPTNSIFHLHLRVGLERRPEFHGAFLAEEPDGHFAFAPFPIHFAQPRRESFGAHGQVEPLLRDAGADDERRFAAGLVEISEHVELKQQHLGGGPIMRRDVRRRHPAARLFPAMKGVLLAAAFPPGEQAGRRLVVPKPPQT